MDPVALERAYRNARYCVDDPAGRLTLRIGEPCTPLQALLRKKQVGAWAFVTACNPRSQRLSPLDNMTRHQRLLVRVSSLGLEALAAHAAADDGGWTEQGLLILGIDEADAIALGSLFEQNAVVVGQACGVAQLRWCAP